MQTTYTAETFDRAAVEQHKGLQVLEFGTGWCGHCQAAQRLLAPVFAEYPQVEHHKIEDGPGRPLGRAFRVKLWPTLVFLRKGQEVARLVRPGDVGQVEEAFEQLAGEG
ncbi:thioredoxin family protein [Pseudomonas typographi]|uniref:Thioredoxin family protein n=1 Tax=Pseudomonas typographi TaxID=2715964 RepID=A0ABR7YX58_9PSED|nr:thioredoxin family protein [Pseudomonas typographi]MBD1551195.1 thioredoxin family protein [Pseudomonas typographi]MBD1586311.1 thioredoxin family protein [Pseudomonas typographi]MBD1597783.1 thioredoxin family protein [Pseudomonas typographi]